MAWPGAPTCWSGTSPEEEAAYQARKEFPQAEAICAINAFGQALEKMGRGTDQRIELELAVFALTQPQAAAPAAAAQPQQARPAAPQPFAAAPAASPPPVQARTAPPPTAARPVPPAIPQEAPPVQEARPLAEEVPPPDEEPEFLQPELRPGAAGGPGSPTRRAAAQGGAQRGSRGTETLPPVGAGIGGPGGNGRDADLLFAGDPCLL